MRKGARKEEKVKPSLPKFGGKQLKFSRTNKFFKFLTFFLTFVTVVILDQVTKTLAQAGSSQLVCNNRFAFGIGTNSSTFNALVVWAVLALTALVFFRIKNDLNKLALVFVFSGGASNLIDRYLGDSCVIDIFHLPSWPSFNLADSAITIGVLLLIFNLFKQKHEA